MPYDPNDPNNDPNNPNQNGQAVSADQSSQTIAQQAASLTAAIKSGQVTPAQAQASLPDNTKIVNGVVVPNDPSLLPIFIMTAAITAPFAVEALTSLASGGAGAAAAGSSSAASTAGAASTGAAATAAPAGLATNLSSLLGTAGKTSGLVSSLSTILGGAAKAAQGQQNTETGQGIDLYRDQTGAELAAKKFALAAPSSRLKTDMTALLSKYDTPTTVNWGGPGSGLKGEIPTFSGGPAAAVRAASSDPNYQALRDQVTQDELVSQMNGGASGGNQDATVATPPQIGQSSVGSKLLGAGAFGSSILAALGKFGGSTPAVPAVPYQTMGPPDPFDPVNGDPLYIGGM